MIFTVTCLNCHKEFKAERSTAKFHSPSCRVEYARKIKSKKEEQLSKFEGKAKIIDASGKVISQPKLDSDKGYPLNEEEKELVRLGVLNKGALLRAKRKIREKWVFGSVVYKPVINGVPQYVARGEYQGGRSKYKPYPGTFGAG
jgi:hypothetical protein